MTDNFACDQIETQGKFLCLRSVVIKLLTTSHVTNMTLQNNINMILIIITSLALISQCVLSDQVSHHLDNSILESSDTYYQSSDQNVFSQEGM